MQARTPEKRMNVSKVEVEISRVASGLVFQTVNQPLCVHRDVTRFLLWCGMDRSRTSFQILKLSNRVDRELMDVAPSSHFSLLLAFTTTKGPARPLPSITLHSAGASECPNVSNCTPLTMYGRGCLHPTPRWTQRVLNYELAHGLRRSGC